MNEHGITVIGDTIVYPSGKILVHATTGPIVGTRAELKRVIEEIIRALQRTDPTAENQPPNRSGT